MHSVKLQSNLSLCASQINRASKSGAEEKRLIVVLEDAHLETVKFGKGFGILNVDEHAGILRKSGRDFTSARPDITHQVRFSFVKVCINGSNKFAIEIVLSVC